MLFEAEEGRLAALDGLARKLWLGGLTNSQGRLEPRLESLAALRAGMLAGCLPPPATWLWPPPAIAAALSDAITDLGLARYCAGEEELS
ncbi:MAG TPA: VWA domain-containing protein, partial [Rhodocyclaceae bacterium]|nr:VWA domain-containing protein [Rhodocyclaceae bacterium]